MRRMSFSATIGQMHAGTKTVTRRAPGTWVGLEAGDRLLAIEKGMGLKAGEKQVVIRPIQIVSNTAELLVEISPADVTAEGFPGMTPAQFIAKVWLPLHGKIEPNAMVRRIEFRHLEAER